MRNFSGFHPFSGKVPESITVSFRNSGTLFLSVKLGEDSKFNTVVSLIDLCELCHLGFSTYVSLSSLA